MYSNPPTLASGGAAHLTRAHCMPVRIVLAVCFPSMEPLKHSLETELLEAPRAIASHLRKEGFNLERDLTAEQCAEVSFGGGGGVGGVGAPFHPEHVTHPAQVMGT